jgi:methyl-accepting chemotaxis protein
MTEKKSTEEAWRQVGRQLETLGESLASTFRTAWQRAEGSQEVQNMQTGLEAMVDKVGQAIKEVGTTAEEKGVRQRMEETAEALHAAGSQTFEEARPHLVSALNQVNAELQKLIRSLQEGAEPRPPDEPAGE